MRISIILLFVISLFNSAMIYAQNKPCYEGIGLYCTVFDTEEATKDFFDKCHQNNIGCVFPSLSGGGTVLWKTDKEVYYTSLKEKLNSGYDALTVFISYAHKNNIKVYPSIAVSPTVLLFRTHPEWETRDRYGKPSSATATSGLAFSFPKAREAKIAAIMDLVNDYDIDGLLLDYCRYPENSGAEEQKFGFYGYDEPIVNACINIYGFDPHKVPVKSEKWNLFNRLRAESVITFVAELRDTIQKSGKSGKIRLGGFGDTDPKLDAESCGRDYAGWARAKYIDDFLLGMYPDPIDKQKEIVMNVRKAIGPDICLYSSLSPFNNFLKTNEEMVAAGKEQLKGGADSLWIYRDDFVDKLNLWQGTKSASELMGKAK